MDRFVSPSEGLGIDLTPLHDGNRFVAGHGVGSLLSDVVRGHGFLLHTHTSASKSIRNRNRTDAEPFS